MGKSTFGSVRQRSSGRYQARYTGPDGAVYTAPVTYVNKGHADDWLAEERLAISKGTWVAPHLRGLAPEEDPLDTQTFGEYAPGWIATRRVKKTGQPLAARTREGYEDLFTRVLSPAFGDRPLRSITKVQVNQWHRKACPDAPTYRAQAYGLLRTILATAVQDDIIPVNPCQIEGASSVKRKRPIHVLKDDEYVLLVKEMPDRYRAMVMLATWTALRFGELAELRRGDVDIEMDDSAAVLRIRRGVTRTKGAVHRKAPKTDAGSRDVTLPPHLVPVLAEHLREHTGPSMVDLLFPAADGTSNLAPSTFYRHYYRAREAVGLPTLHFHALRHTGAVWAARSGATLADLMARLGHATPDAAMRYQHTAQERDAAIAAEMSRRASMA